MEDKITGRSIINKKALDFSKALVIPLGFEPRTPSLKGMCSTC